MEFHRQFGRIPVRHLAAGLAGNFYVIAVAREIGDRIEFDAAHVMSEQDGNGLRNRIYPTSPDNRLTFY